MSVLRKIIQLGRKIPKTGIVEGIMKYTQPSNHTRHTMMEILKTRFPNAKKIDVEDVSGGCGAMFEVIVESADFKGLSIVKQHRLINDSLKEQIKDMHGIRIHTTVPSNS